MSPTIIVVVIFAALAGLAIRLMRNHGPSTFSSKVNGALFDLGLQAMKLGGELKDYLSRECLAYHGAMGKKAKPHELAARFFLRAVIDFPAHAEQALMFEGVLVRSIPVMREWKRLNRVSESTCEEFVLKIKRFLVEGVKEQGLPLDEGLIMEIRILEL